MKDPTDQENRRQQVLDRVATQLREQPIPEMPSELREWDPLQRSKTIPVPFNAASIRVAAVAAGVLLVLGLGVATVRLMRDTPESSTSLDPPIETAKTIGSGEIVVEELLTTARLDVMYEELDGIDREIQQLKQKAILLDARRKASELLSMLASTR